MYADPRHIKTNRVPVNLDEDQHAVLIALSAVKGKQPAAFARELLMERIAQLTLDQDNEVAHAA